MRELCAARTLLAATAGLLGGARSFAFIAVGFGLTASAGAQVPHNTIALTGQAAPGTPAGVSYQGLFVPIINDAGQVAYFAGLTGSGVTTANDETVYAGSFAAPQLVMREGDPAPGTPAGVKYSIVGGPAALNDAGQLAYLPLLTGSGVTTANQGTLYAGNATSPQLVARSGDAAPGTPAGVTYSTFSVSGLNDAGQLAYIGFLTGTGVTTTNNRALYAGAIGAPHLVARKGAPAPGTAAGVNYGEFFDTFSPNDAGQVAYRVSLSGSGVTTANDEAIYAGSFTAPQLVVRDGNPAPGTPAGVNYSSLIRPMMNDVGQVAYTARLAGSGVTSVNDEAIYAGDLAARQLVAREGNAAPGTPPGVRYSNISNATPILNDSGQVVYLTGMTGTGVTSANDQGIYAGAFAAPQLIARKGSAAPGTPPGVNFAFLNDPTLNDLGQVVYFASLSGIGVTTANDRGLFAFDPVLGALVIAREGDLFDVGDGDFRTIAHDGIGFFAGASDDRGTSLSNNGTAVFSLLFTDGTRGIFTAAVPEPASALSLSVIPAAALLTRRRRSRS